MEQNLSLTEEFERYMFNMLRIMKENSMPDKIKIMPAFVTLLPERNKTVTVSYQESPSNPGNKMADNVLIDFQGSVWAIPWDVFQAAVACYPLLQERIDNGQ